MTGSISIEHNSIGANLNNQKFRSTKSMKPKTVLLPRLKKEN